jgi:hypothetical protein
VTRIAPAALLLCGVAFAQGDAGNDDIRKASSLSSRESAVQGHDFLTKMQASERRVSKLQERAQKQKDVIKLNCVTDKLVQLRGHVAVANQSISALDEAVARGDDGARQHEYVRLVIMHQKTDLLTTEAENCLGEDVSYVGNTKVDVEVDPSIPNEDPTQPTLPLPDVTRPPEATPFA